MKSPFFLIPAFLLLLFGFAPENIEVKQPAFVTDSLDQFIAREMKAWEIPGLAIAVVKDGKVIVSKGFGVQETGTDRKVNDETIFQVASCTKAFTATALALLASQKKLSLDDTVRKWLPDFSLYDPLATRQVTIRDLLCHRIGFQTFQGDFANWNSNLSRKQIIGLMAAQKPVYGFRAQYGYCNSAYVAAAEIIPEVTGKTWDDYVTETFFGPLQMTRTSTTSAAIRSDKNACKPHAKWNGRISAIAYDNIDNLGPAGSINSCVKDFSHWLLMQLDSGRYEGKQVVPFPVLQETRKAQTLLPATPAIFPGMHFQTYGLGWFMADFYGKKIIWHNGGADGFLSVACFVPELNLGFVILTNSDNNNLFTALRYQLLDAYLSLPYRNYSAIFRASAKRVEAIEQKELDGYRKKADALPALPVDAKEFAGTYENGAYGKMTVAAEGGKLGATFEHHPKVFGRLEYMGDNTFLCTFNGPMWAYKPAPFRVVNGKVESITISVNDAVDKMAYEFRKLPE
ncbi:MAG TPA: serine hydrolase [Bacteroidia bacterium]|nr:serine hydrolase [Bacteroidia bacterium]